MNEYLDNIQTFYSIAIAAITIISGFITWLTATYNKIHSGMKMLESLTKEFKPNGGTSLKDALNRIENELNEIKFMKMVYWDVIDTPIFIADNDGKYIWANKAYLKLVGLTLIDICGTGWERVISDEDRIDVVKEWYRACSEVRPFHMKFKMVSNDMEILVKTESYGKTGVGYIGFVTPIK